MHLSTDLCRLITSLDGLFITILLFIQPTEVAAETNGPSSLRLLPRDLVDSVTLPVQKQTLSARSPGNNSTFGGGYSPLTLTQDRQSYYTVIKAGPFNFRVALDTGSADLWLVSTACETETCKNAPQYPLEFQSPTFISVANNLTNFTASYADGTFASGFVAAETIELTNITLSNQTFAAITNSNVSLTDKTSGIMGLGFPRLSSISNLTTNTTPFFSTLARQGLLEYPMFSFSLDKNSSGVLTLGAVDSSVVTNASHIGWNKVAQFPPFSVESLAPTYLQWAIPLAGFTVNATQYTPIPTYPRINHNSLALFDIGAPGIYGPYQDVSRLYSTIDGARLVDPSGQWAVPCDTVVNIAFTFGQRNYTLFPTDYIFDQVSGNPNMCLSWPMSLPPSSDGIDWQMGTAFLRTVYSIFSFGIDTKEPPLIGLYSVQNNTNTSQTPDDVLSFISAFSATAATTLPNFLVPTPTFTTPPYALNSSVSASVGGIVATGLANTTYSPIFGQHTTLTNISALPQITPSPTVVTLVVTNSVGNLTTTTFSPPMMSVTLGLPSSSSPVIGQSIHLTWEMLSCIILTYIVTFVWTI